MRRIDPARTTRDTRTEQEFEVDLAQIITSTSKPKRDRRVWITLPAAAAVLAVLFALQPWGGAMAPAHAVTPPMLTIAPMEADAEQILERARSQLAAGEPRAAERRSYSEGWQLNIDIDDSGPPTSVVAPQVRLTEWSQDLSGRILITAGEAYVPDDGRKTPPPSGAAPAAGTVLADESFAAGQMPVAFPTEPPSTTEEMRAYLETGGADPTAGAVGYLYAIRALLMEWTLDGQQQAAILEVLSGLEGVEAAGRTVDRLGRSAVALRVASDKSPQWEHLVLVDEGSGHCLAVEDIYLGGIPDLDLPSPAVAIYTTWR